MTARSREALRQNRERGSAEGCRRTNLESMIELRVSDRISRLAMMTNVKWPQHEGTGRMIDASLGFDGVRLKNFHR